MGSLGRWKKRRRRRRRGDDRRSRGDRQEMKQMKRRTRNSRRQEWHAAIASLRRGDSTPPATGTRMASRRRRDEDSRCWLVVQLQACHARCQKASECVVTKAANRGRRSGRGAAVRRVLSQSRGVERPAAGRFEAPRPAASGRWRHREDPGLEGRAVEHR